jgi:Domain of unknown function (DUF4375)
MKGIMEHGILGYDIDTILASGEPYAVVGALVAAIGARESKRLVGREIDIYWPYKVHASIMWDGIHGTLFNFGLILLVRSTGGMENIGAIERTGILRQAIESFGDPNRVNELVKRFSVDVITSEQKKLFDELSTRYFQVKERTEELIVAYIRQHIDEFRNYKSMQSPPC